MSVHTSAKDKPWVRSHREFYERMGWKFSPSVVGRGIRAQKFVNGVVVKEFKICCINRLLIQIKAYEATLPGKRR